ncbi:MAG TPA: hypothetical protein VGM41_12940 [Chitinophagaceae bacterium]
MAKLSGGFLFTGKIGNASAYTMRGVDGIILRSPGGASKNKIKTHENFRRTRELNAEFGGRATAGQHLRRACSIQKSLADYNIAGPINAMLLPIQRLDMTSKRGQRNVVLSQNPRLLEGFSFNKKNTFDSTIRNPLSYTLSRDTLSARIDIPTLLPGITFFAPDKYPFFSIQAVLGITPDLFYDSPKYKPSSDYYSQAKTRLTETGWRPVQKGLEATTLELAFTVPPPDQSFSLVLTIGVCYGIMIDTTSVSQAKYAGCAKILAMG